MYEVSEDKLQELNVIVGEKGGVIPSKVSDALAALQIAINAGDSKEAAKQMRIAIEANKLNGAAWSDVQTWHDDVKASGTGPVDPPVDPPTIPSGAIDVTKEITPLSGYYMALPDIPADGRNRTFIPMPGYWYAAKLATPGDRVSDSCDNGQVTLGWGPTPYAMTAGGTYNNSGMLDANFGGGEYMIVGIPANRAPNALLYSFLKYGG